MYLKCTNKAKGLFSIVLTPKPRLHVAVNKGSLARGRNCDNSYLVYPLGWYIVPCRGRPKIQNIFIMTLKVTMIDQILPISYRICLRSCWGLTDNIWHDPDNILI